MLQNKTIPLKFCLVDWWIHRALFIFCVPLQIHAPFFSPLPWEADFYGLIKGLRLPSGFQLDLVSERHCGRWESEKRLGFYSLLPSFCGLHSSTKGYSSFRKPSLYPLWDPLLLPLLVPTGLEMIKAPCHSQTPVQFNSVQSLSCVRLFVTPWTTARQASLSIINSWSLLKLMSIE